MTRVSDRICEALAASPRTRVAQQASGLSRGRFVTELHRLERTGRVSWTPEGWAVAPRRRTRRSLGVIS